MTPAEICSKRFPELDQKLATAIDALAPWDNSGRALASEKQPLDTVDRESWLRWAEEQLADAQHYMDQIDGLPSQTLVRDELSDIATSFVSFHGYARQGKGESMVKTLQQIRAHSEKARTLACPNAKSVAGA